MDVTVVIQGVVHIITVGDGTVMVAVTEALSVILEFVGATKDTSPLMDLVGINGVTMRE